jgi:hypothetical protein
MFLCRGPSQVRFISDQTPLNEVFKIFKKGFSHMMISIAFFDPDSGERLSQAEVIQRSKAKDAHALSVRQVSCQAQSCIRSYPLGFQNVSDCCVAKS